MGFFKKLEEGIRIGTTAKHKWNPDGYIEKETRKWEKKQEKEERRMKKRK